MEKKKNIVEYQLIKIIKKTESTVIYLANKNFMAIKNIIRQIDLSKISEQEKLLFENEIKINSLFNTRFILKIEDNNINKNQLNIITEYFEGETLTKFLENEQKKDRKFLKEEIIWKIFIQICFALYHIHNKNIIHRNINSNNILIDAKYNIKLTNFKKGYKLKSENDLCNEFNINENSKNINAPEIILKEGYNTKIDIWYLGVLLYQMCSFNNPFNAENEEELNKKILGNLYPTIGNKYSKELINLLDQLFIKNQKERPSIKDIINQYVFISKSQEANLYGHLDKLINPKKTQKKIFPYNPNKKTKRPSSALYNKKEDKKSPNYIRNKELEKKRDENDIEALTEKFFEVKTNVKNIIGEENADNFFKELTDVNFDEIAIKYYKNDNNNNMNYKDEEKFKMFKKNVEEYINIMDKVYLIQNKG